MICAAQFTDNSWYRAKVVELPGRRIVNVQYVDFGNVERVSAWQLRKLPDKFLTLPPQALHCQLADVEPVDKQNGWTSDAMKVVDRYRDRQLAMRITGGQGQNTHQICPFSSKFMPFLVWIFY